MKMEPTSATGSLKHDLMCKELIIDVPLAMEPAQWPECCIYRVPKNLRQINEEAYSPKLISIGPFHHGKEEVRDMEKLKVRYLKVVLLDSIFISSEDFVKVVLLDSIFIIELFLRANDKDEFEKDYMSSKPMLNCNIQAKLILLENQLPFFILKEIHKKFSKGRNSDNSFFTLASKYFASYIKNTPAEKNEVKHSTDLIRYCLCLPRSDFEFKDRICDLYSATKLHAAGVVFKKNDKKGLLDIKFQKFQPLINVHASIAYGC